MKDFNLAIEPDISGGWMVMDHSGGVSTIVFSGTQAECERYVRNQERNDDRPCPCGRSHTVAEHNYNPDDDE